jgi:hypothetical protein
VSRSLLDDQPVAAGSVVEKAALLSSSLLKDQAFYQLSNNNVSCSVIIPATGGPSCVSWSTGPGVEKDAPLLQSEVESTLSICIVEDLALHDQVMMKCFCSTENWMTKQ